MVKSKAKKLTGTAWHLEIEISKEKVEEVFDQVLGDIKKEAKIPGFRPGKAPMDIIQKKHSEEAKEEVKRFLIPEGYQAALKEHSISPLSYPEVSDIEINASGALVFKAKVDTYPEFTLKQYKGLKVTSGKIGVTEEEVDGALDRIKGVNADFADIDGPLQKGNFGICDVETFMDGESISKKRENMWIEVDKEASMLGMGEELCGLKKNDTKDIEAVLSENYPDKKYAGKKAVFHVEIKETKEKKLPEMNDDLAKKVGKNSLKELREELHAQLLERKEANSKVEMKNQILEQLLKKHSLDLPESMVTRQLKVLIEKAEKELAHKGIEKEAIESHKEKLKDQLSKDAENKVKAYFILDEITNREEISTTDEDVDVWLTSLAQAYNQPFDEVKKYYGEHDLIDGLKEQLREEKALDFLLKEADVVVKK